MRDEIRDGDIRRTTTAGSWRTQTASGRRREWRGDGREQRTRPRLASGFVCGPASFRVYARRTTPRHAVTRAKPVPCPLGHACRGHAQSRPLTKQAGATAPIASAVTSLLRPHLPILTFRHHTSTARQAWHKEKHSSLSFQKQHSTGPAFNGFPPTETLVAADDNALARTMLRA